jgi:hypothetical protein
VANSCERGNESLDSIHGGGFLDWLSDYQLPKKDSRVSYRMGGGTASLSHPLTGFGISGFQASKSSTWVFC